MTDLKVTIVGAGLGGLVLARVLSLQNVGVEIFEADSSPGTRTQGGLLDIHVNDGQFALRECGLYEKFRTLVLEGADATRVVDRHGAVLFDDDGTNGGRPEILRGDLRQMLIDSLPDGTIHWGKKLADVKALTDGRHSLTFADGSTVDATLLVGADGTWSKVRRLLSSAPPSYVGIVYIESMLRDVATRHADVSRMLGAGSTFLLEPHRGIGVHRERSNLHAYIQLRKPVEWVQSIDWHDDASARARVAAEFDGWSPHLVRLITASDAPLVPRQIHALPDGHRWPHVRGVTLVGDAAHVAPPAGDGANLAMLDGALLGKLIATHRDDVEQALLIYEQAMFERNVTASADAMQILDLCLGESAPHGLVAFFNTVKH